jgi:hypothetical protein
MFAQACPLSFQRKANLTPGLQVQYLKQIVLDAVEMRFQTRLSSLTLYDIRNDPQFCFFDADTKHLLEQIGDCHDRLPKLSTFLLVDPASILTLLAVYTLSQAAQGSLVGGSHKEDFLASFSLCIAEASPIPSLLSQQLTRGTAALEDVRADRPLPPGLHRSPDRGRVPRGQERRAVRLPARRGRGVYPPELHGRLPGLQGHCAGGVQNEQARLPHQQVQLHGSPCLYPFLYPPDPLYQVASVEQHYKFKAGIALDIWHTIQQNKIFIHNIRTSEEAFFLLPATRFSREPGRHSTAIEDTYQLACKAGMARRV